MSSLLNSPSAPKTVQTEEPVDKKNKVIGIIDLGSNSARLLLVQVAPDGAYSVINRVKHMVRLGENAFETKMLQESAMQRTLIVLHSFMEMCQKYEVSEIFPMATAAMRDANNAIDFLHKVREETGLELQIISGHEEARLICLGVSSGLPASLGLRVYIDIGGGSTEVAVANTQNTECLDSLKVGCVRVTNKFLSEYTDKVPKHIFAAMCTYVRSKASHTTGRLKNYALAELVGSSGTALALQNIGHRLQFGSAPTAEQNTLSIEGLRLAIKHICNLTAEERRHLPGVNTRRAEVLVAGAAILLTLMEDFDFTQLTVSTRNLQDGILMDYLQRHSLHTEEVGNSVREKSILQLANRCQYEVEHSRHVANLTLQIHDSAVDVGLIRLDHQARELLHYAALLHDIGIFIAYAKHAVHGAYIINKSELLGFTEDEIEFMATLVQMHNLKLGRKSFSPIPKGQGLRRHLKLFPIFLALAENMDRLHCSHVQETHFARIKEKLSLIISGKNISPVEVDAVSIMDELLQCAVEEKVNIHFTELSL